ncbi:alpha-ketoglutarate-dependent dioxygenase AlkB family protein [Sanyastnella coralliicola]|uniref:alpha-ketoglutarate-dependent dioxygenase AlkB family protein n=1 Tax=Sanyastnella coralliicola TaxID=3069118 RepID=UPI0027B9681C|nr:alpha-ketoglutarate-dependent dioxygenase AlkB [Longitalea sp. SCSIO 12813]
MELVLSDGHASAEYYPYFVEDLTLDDLINRVSWRQNDIKMYGKVFQEPRLTAWYGPPYRYSSIQWEEQAFPDFLESLRVRLSALAKFEFNAVLLNYYRDGQDHMGWHRDNEKEIDHQVIASVSFGTSRTFRMREKETKEKFDIELEDRSLLLMKHMQERYEHMIPKRARVHEARINLTFRRIIA